MLIVCKGTKNGIITGIVAGQNLLESFQGYYLYVCDATRMCMNEARMLTNNFMSATLHALCSAACYQRDARMCMNEARMCMNIHETFMAICGRLSDTVGW